MEFNNWIVFLSIILIASISPGPNIVAVVTHTINAGIRGAVFTILGNLLALFTIAAAAAVGVGTLIHTIPNVFTAMKVAGGIYLAYIGIRLIRNSFNSNGALDVSTNEKKHTKNIEFSIRAMLISFSNPKSILFLSAIFPTFLDNSSPIVPQFMVMFLTIIVIVLTIHGTYAFVAFQIKDSLVGTRASRYMARFSGLSFLGFGLGFVYNAQK